MKKDLGLLLSFTIPNDGCLEWTRCLNTDGYPRAVIDGSVNGKVHRVVYELVHQQDITGMVIRHTCDNPLCINPEHLLAGTPTENMLDRDSRDRHGKAKITHEQVRAIRALWNSGKFKQNFLANQFGLDARTISSMVNGHHWKHVV